MSLRLGVARRSGLDDTMAAKVDDYEASDIPEHQKVALRLADAYLRWPGGIDEPLRRQVFAHFTPAQAVEILLDVSKWSTQKLPVALGLDAPVNPDGLALFDFDNEGRVIWGGPIAPS